MKAKCRSVASSEVPAVTIYTFVHLAVGYAIARYLKPNLLHMVLLVAGHVLFEIWENTEQGVRFFNNSLWDSVRNFFRTNFGFDLWCQYPGDSLANSVCDTIAFSAGVYLGSKNVKK